MLNVIEYGKDEYDFPALLVLGCFDAIHVGHRDLIKKAKLQAKINGLDLGVMLFRDGKGGKTVYSFEERLAILEEYAVKFVLVIDYTEEFKATAPLDFLHAIEEKVNVKAYMSGKDFRFGANAKGKSSTLKTYAEDEDNGVWYMPVKDVMAGNEKISTTLIKQYLENGDIATANELLGSEFCVSGEVVKGAGRGAEQLGYPTVNIAYPENKYPVKQGVYAVKSVIGGTVYYGIANYGTCPTFGDERVALEVNFDGYEGDLYGETLNIKFLGYMRDITAFASPEELVAQLNADKAALENYKQPEVVEEAVAEPVAQPVAQEETVVEEAPAEETEEEVVAEAEEVTEEVAEEIEISANEYKELESGWDEVMDEAEEPQSEEVATGEVAEPAEEVIEEAAEEVAEEVVEEEFAEEADAEIIEEETEVVAVEEVAAEESEAAACEEAEEDIIPEETEVLDGGFDETVEEAIEEPVEETQELEEAQPEVVEEVEPQPEEVETEEEQSEEAAAEEGGEENVD